MGAAYLPLCLNLASRCLPRFDCRRSHRQSDIHAEYSFILGNDASNFDTNCIRAKETLLKTPSWLFRNESLLAKYCPSSSIAFAISVQESQSGRWKPVVIQLRHHLVKTAFNMPLPQYNNQSDSCNQRQTRTQMFRSRTYYQLTKSPSCARRVCGNQSPTLSSPCGPGLIQSPSSPVCITRT